MEQRDDLIEIRPHLFLSKTDPNYYKKYLSYHPMDDDTRYKYGLELEKNKQYKQAYQQFTRASQHGHALSKRKCSQYTKQRFLSPPAPVINHKRFPWGWLSMLVVCLICLALILLWHPSPSQDTHPNTAATPSKSSSHTGAYRNDSLTPHDIQYAVIFNAIRHYQQAHRTYPKTLSQLTQPYPNNWLSYIPSDIAYSTTGNSFTLEAENLHLPTRVQEISLEFFPSTHQIGLYLGRQLLTLYTVADGKSALPFRTSKVSLRVAMPNGPGSALGTRGLYLEKHYAIHGTNQPSSIGKSVSHGCIRLSNQHIAALYPYVSIGTPFIVKKGKPNDSPLFKKGLPLPSLPTINKETTATHFVWLH